jgi:hypothetical protein
MTVQAHELTKDYKYGFHDVDISVFRTEKGLSPEVVAAISDHKSEPEWMLKFRLIIYARPSWQQSVDPIYGDHRLLPDTAWKAAVNGGVDVYITAYPQYNCGNTTGCSSVYGARRLQHRRPLRLSLWSTPPGPRRPRGPSGSSTPSCTTASARLITATSSRSTAVRPRPPSPAPRSA